MDMGGYVHPDNPPHPQHSSLMRSRARTLRSIVALTVLSVGLMAAAPLPELLHVLGIVASIDEKHMDVKTMKGQVVSVLLTKQVKYKNKNNPKSIDPPAVGDRVIIEASRDEKNKKVTATVVHYSPGSIPPSPR